MNVYHLSMKYLALLFVGLFVFVSAPVQAEEITMICKYDGQSRIHKYVNPMFGSKKVLQRIDGEWVSWGRKTPTTVSSKLKINNRGAVLEEVHKLPSPTNVLKYDIKKGDKFLKHTRVILDFEFLKMRKITYGTRVDGSPFLKTEKMDGYHPETPFNDEWNCSRY